MPSLSKIRYNNTDYDLFGLGGDVLPVGTEIDIAESTTVPAGWEQINKDQEIYKSQERRIGYWTNGKPLYLQIFRYDNTININNTGYIDISSIGFDNIISLEGTAVYDGDASRVCPFNTEQMKLQIFNSVINIENKSYLSLSNIIVLLKYTKTVDTAITVNELKRIKKVSQIAPTSAGETYDGQERVIGTWFGKPLYRKVFTTDNAIIDTSSLNVEHYVKIYGFCTRADGEEMPIPKAYPEAAWNVCINQTTSTVIGITVGSGYTGNIAVTGYTVIIEYTKTTDNASL